MTRTERTTSTMRSTRRRFLLLTFGSTGALLLATACAQAPASPTPAPPTAAPAPPPPTPVPTTAPTAAPTVAPTVVPTTAPPTAAPTAAPTSAPTAAATAAATPAYPTITLPPIAAWSSTPSAAVQVSIAEQGFPPPQQALYEKFNQEFLERHANFKLNVTYTAWDDFLAKWLPQAAAGTLPDVSYADDTWMLQFIKKRLATELTPLITSDSGFNLGAFPKQSLVPGQSQGKLYAIPYGWVGRSLGYRKDLFDKAGLKYPDESWTWDDVRQAAIKLTIPGQQWGFYIGSWGSWPTQGDFLAPFGGAVVDDTETKSLIATPASIKAIQWWADLVLKDKAALGDWKVGTGVASGLQGHPFALGKAAMTHWASWGTPSYLKQNPKLLEQAVVAIIPKGPAAQTVAACDSRYFVTSQSKNVDAAWTYLREYMSPRGQAEVYAAGGWDWTIYPESQPYYLNSPVMPPTAKLWVDTVSRYGVVCRPISAPSSQIQRTMGEQFNDLWTGKADAAGVAKAIDAAIQPLLAQN